MARKQVSSSGTATPSTSFSTTTAVPTTSTNAQSSTSKSFPTSASTSASTSLSSKSSPQDIAVHVWNQYLKNTPPRTKLLDTFMAFLVVVGGVQFVYCVIAGNYPFNAFLSGFSAAVGQFVLLASLRMQTSSPDPNLPSLHSTSSLISQTTNTTSNNAAAGASLNISASGKDKASGEVIEDLGLGGKGYSQERAFADFVFGSVILHAFCVNFIN